MSGKVVTAQSVNDRVDAMGDAFKDMRDRVKGMRHQVEVINSLIVGLLAPDQDELRGVIDQMDAIQKDLRDAPDARRVAKVELIKAQESIADVTERIANREANTMLDICAEINVETGKLKYSNDKLRANALRLRTRKDKEHQKLAAELKRLEMDKAHYDAALRRVEDNFKASRVIFGGLVAHLQNITARLLAPPNRKE